MSPPWATHRGSRAGLSPRKGACVPLHGLGETEQSDREGRGRADGTTSRERLKEKLLSRQPRLPGPAVALCGYQPSTAARVNQDIRLPRLQAEGRGTPLKHERGKLGWGPRVGGLGGDPAWGTPLCASSALLLCGLFGSQLSQDPALISLLARPVVFTNSQEGETRSSKVNLVTGSGRRAAVRFLNQVNLGNPNSST